ncbi:TetR/AcrR family transcriptional regulator [Deinococcus pimensis]|uniref:TetR/AcrR family transcriptional regulator n=1 Tax=Deinococcus pimensis TaxID=309888 RepID=UPI000481999E|nr:TetR family transcriptional regulator [Deinococcus pimensis]
MSTPRTAPARARRDEDKTARREAILDAASRVWDERGYASATMTDVARETRLAKGTLYLYFRTKEELFLALLARQLWTWFDRVDADLAALSAPQEARTLAAHLTEALRGTHRMVDLLTLLSAILEQNVPIEATLAFKAGLGERLRRTGGVMERLLPHLREGQGARVLLHFSALVVGLHQVATPVPAAKAATLDPQLHFLVLDFHEELHVALTALLLGTERAG